MRDDFISPVSLVEYLWGGDMSAPVSKPAFPKDVEIHFSKCFPKSRKFEVAKKRKLVYIVWSESVRGDYIKPSEQISRRKYTLLLKKAIVTAFRSNTMLYLSRSFLGPFLKTCWRLRLSFLAHRLLSWCIRKRSLVGTAPHTEYVLSPHLFPWS